MNNLLLIVAMATVAAGSYVAPRPHVVAGPVLVRAPQHDSAIIQSHRLGGNFAYSTHEAHAFAAQRPIIGHRTVPVGVSYHPGRPVVHTSTDFVTAHVPQYGYTYNHQVAAPALQAAAPVHVAGPVVHAAAPVHVAGPAVHAAAPAVHVSGPVTLQHAAPLHGAVSSSSSSSYSSH